MENEIKISLTGDDNLLKAMCLTKSIQDYIDGWKIIGESLCLYWCAKGEQVNKLPYRMTPEEATVFVKGWLRGRKPVGPEPITDGSTGVGWELHSTMCPLPKAPGQSYAHITITPIWFIYGK